jgi:gamma-glutamylcyclotransferase (GGCT)/AIG2-like uncharacterized protein YtfP
MTNKPTKLFVYGTLRVAQGNHAAIARYVLDVEPATTQGILLDLGSFPALVAGTGIVQGEVLTIEPEALATTDRIEGVSHGVYERRQVEARLESGAVVEAWAYFYARPEQIVGYPQLGIGEQGPVRIYGWRR